MTTIRLFIHWLTAWPAIPKHLSLNDYQRAVLLHKALWMLFFSLIFLSVPWVLLVNSSVWIAFWSLLLALAVITTAALLLDWGQSDLAAHVLVFGVLFIAIAGNILLDNLHGNDLPILLILLVFGSVLLSLRAMVVCSVLCVAGLWLVAFVHASHFDAQMRSIEWGHLLSGTIVLGMVSTFSIWVRNQLTDAIAQIQADAEDLAEKNVVLAVQNQALEARTRQVSTLMEVSNRIGSTLELRSLIPLMLESVKVVLPYDDAFVMERVGSRQLRAIGYSGPDDFSESLWEYSPEKDAPLRYLFEARAPLIIPDILADDPLAKARRDRIIEFKGYLPDFIRSCLYVPLLRRNDLVGYFILNSAKANAYSDKDLPIASGLSHQFAMCIENARLYESAMQTATLAERNRIARELHDSVSQALFGIVLGMRTLAEVSRISPGKMEEAMNYVIRLADVALVEIRALIFELRPEYLEKEGLIATLKKQVEGLCMRHQIELKMQVTAEEKHLSGRAKEALYRIGLEATRNTIKHASARTIEINLREVSQHSVMLEVNDDGNGFDPNGTFEGHFGLVSMRERAQQFGGNLQVLSWHGQGTTVRVSIPIPA